MKLVEEAAMAYCAANPNIPRGAYQGCVCVRDSRRPADGGPACKIRVARMTAALSVFLAALRREPSPAMEDAWELAQNEVDISAARDWSAMVAERVKEWGE